MINWNLPRTSCPLSNAMYPRIVPVVDWDIIPHVMAIVDYKLITAIDRRKTISENKKKI